MKLYRIGKQRGTLLPATRKTLDKINAYVLKHGPQTMEVLKMLSCNHKPGDGSNPDRFAPYAVKLGWFKEVS